MNDAIKNLKVASQLIADAKILIQSRVEIGRVLPLEDDLHEAQDIARKIGSDNATIESELGTFERMSFGSRRFSVGQRLMDFGKKLDEAINKNG